MAPGINCALPAMQLLCNIVIPGTPSFSIANAGPAVNYSPSQVQPAILPDGYVAYPDIGAAYKVYYTKVSWKVARKLCIAEGAKLAVIDSFLKLEHLLNLSEDSGSIYVGVRRLYAETWISTTTGSTLKNLPWAPDEPFGPIDCVTASKSPPGLINFECTSLRTYVCELPISENYNGQKNQKVYTISGN